jgi:hypothetical protein
LRAVILAGVNRIARAEQLNDQPVCETIKYEDIQWPPDAELGAGRDACMASLGRPAAQGAIKALMERGFHKPGDVEDRLGYHVGELGR